MKLLLLTDIHGRLSRVRELAKEVAGEAFDAVIVAGDITYFESLEKALKILRTIKSSLNTPVYFIAGNCDPVELLYVNSGKGLINIHTRIESIGEYSIYGIGGSNITPFNTNIEWSEDEIRELLRKAEGIERRRLIMVTHAPPHGILDRVDGLNVGSTSLREFLDNHGALLWVTGHIHESRGVVEYKDTVIVNPGPLMWKYYAVAEIRDGRVSISLEELS